MKISKGQLKKIINEVLLETSKYVAPPDGPPDKSPATKWVDNELDEPFKDFLRQTLMPDYVDPGSPPEGVSLEDHLNTTKDSEVYKDYLRYHYPTDFRHGFKPEVLAQLSELFGQVYGDGAERDEREMMQIYGMRIDDREADDVPAPLRAAFFGAEHRAAVAIFNEIAESQVDTISDTPGRYGTTDDDLKDGLADNLGPEVSNALRFYSSDKRLPFEDEDSAGYGDEYLLQMIDLTYDRAIALLQKNNYITDRGTESWDLTQKGYDLIIALGWNRHSVYHDHPNARQTNPRTGNPGYEELFWKGPRITAEDLDLDLN